MVRRTKLWQDAGSPLISGRSGRQSPLWRAWLAAALSAFAVAVGAAWLLMQLAIANPGQSVAVSILWGLVGSAAGAFLGVWLSRRMGWGATWLVGTVSGAVLAVALFLSFA